MGDMYMKQCEKGHFYDDMRFDSCPYCKDGTGLGKQAVAAFQNQQIPQFQPVAQQPVASAPVSAPVNQGFKFCTNCGNKAEAAQKFCTNCGKPFPAPIQQPAASEIGQTVAVSSTPTSDIGKTVALRPMGTPSSDIGKTVAVSSAAPSATDDIGKTVALQPIAPVSSPTSDIGKTVAVKPIDFSTTQKPEKTKPVAFMVCIAGGNTGDSYTLAEGRNYIASGSDADIKLNKDSNVSADCHAVVTYNPSNNQFTLSAGTGRGITYLNGNQVDVSAEIKADDRIKVGESELLFIPVCTDKFKWDAQA